MISALKEGWPPRGGHGGQEALVRFGVCPGSEGSPVAALARLVGAGDRLRVMHPETGHHGDTPRLARFIFSTSCILITMF